MPFASGIQANSYYTKLSFTQPSYTLDIMSTIGGSNTKFTTDFSNIPSGIKVNFGYNIVRNPKVTDFRA